MKEPINSKDITKKASFKDLEAVCWKISDQGHILVIYNNKYNFTPKHSLNKGKAIIRIMQINFFLKWLIVFSVEEGKKTDLSNLIGTNVQRTT